MIYELYHSGVAHDENPPGRGSGRYGYGTGENPYQHEFTFRSEVRRLKKQGMPEIDIAHVLIGKDATTDDLRIKISRERTVERKYNMEKALKLLDECNGNKSEAARKMGIAVSSFTNLLNEKLDERTNRYDVIADRIRKRVDEKGAVDVGKGSELYMGPNVAQTTKKVALKILQDEGYKMAYVKVRQPSGNYTNVKALVRPDYYKKVFDKSELTIFGMEDYTPDGGKTWWVPEFPRSIDSKRIFIRYGDQGGKSKDGVIELRKNVEDISLGNSRYAQVRIAVDGDKYMKGMAIYADGRTMPKGYDIVYNTYKPSGTPPEKIFKAMKRDKDGNIDKDNPFGAAIKKYVGQRHYIDENGKDQLSLINKINEEGDWDSWGKNLSAQFLSKQPLKLLKGQLDLTISEKRAALDEIKSITNPVVQKKLLENYAGKCDSNAADLSAVGFKNQAFQVLLPVSSLSDNEIYAPKYKDGDTVALIRYPHGGTFEIPILKVNNKHPQAKSIIGDAKDAVGINEHVAEQLSGADFDGDTALVIPMASNNIRIAADKAMRDLVGFDNKTAYKLPDSAPPVTNRYKQKQMGVVTNLISDMTAQGADLKEIIRADKHSMVVIDAEKHHLDINQSARDHNINELKKKYQTHIGLDGKVHEGGAATIFSRAKAQYREPNRKEITDRKKMTPEEVKAFEAGKKIYRYTGETSPVRKEIKDPSKMTPEELKRHEAGKKVYRETGKTIVSTTKMHQMDVVDDAMLLVRDKNNPKEVAYANFANSMKALGDEARSLARSIKPYEVDPVAKKTYAAEIESLNEKIRRAHLNDPKERQAIAICEAKVFEKKKANPDMDYEHEQRVRGQAIQEARMMVGAGKEKIEITPREWEAIQAHAITTNKLKEIVNNTDQDKLTKLAMPKKTAELKDWQINLAKAMAANPMYTYADIADRLGVSASYISKIV